MGHLAAVIFVGRPHTAVGNESLAELYQNPAIHLYPTHGRQRRTGKRSNVMEAVL